MRFHFFMTVSTLNNKIFRILSLSGSRCHEIISIHFENRNIGFRYISSAVIDLLCVCLSIRKCMHCLQVNLARAKFYLTKCLSRKNYYCVNQYMYVYASLNISLQKYRERSSHEEREIIFSPRYSKSVILVHDNRRKHATPALDRCLRV